MKPDRLNLMTLEMTDRHQNCVAVTLVLPIVSSVGVNAKRLELTRYKSI
jgi:hypothetical protein